MPRRRAILCAVSGRGTRVLRGQPQAATRRHGSRVGCLLGAVRCRVNAVSKAPVTTTTHDRFSAKSSARMFSEPDSKCTQSNQSLESTFRRCWIPPLAKRPNDRAHCGGDLYFCSDSRTHNSLKLLSFIFGQALRTVGTGSDPCPVANFIGVNELGIGALNATKSSPPVSVRGCHSA